jgi:cysteine-S-conjugate beta-lyase
MDEFARVERSSTNAEKYVLRQKLFGTDAVIPMWVADMDIATPQCVLDAVGKRLAHPVLGYEMMSDTAFEAQIDWFAAHHNFVMKREWLSYSPSVVASIGCAIRAYSDRGDEVIVMDPVYPPFYAQVRENDRSPLIHSLIQDADGLYRFDLDRLGQQVSGKTKLLLLCSPHNPIGRVWSHEELTSLCRWCEERGIVILSDEIHCDLIYTPHKHIPTARISPENTVMLSGPGKTFNMAGFSISTVSIPSESLRSKFEAERKKVHWGEGAVLSHVAFEAAYREGGGVVRWFDEPPLS